MQVSADYPHHIVPGIRAIAFIIQEKVDELLAILRDRILCPNCMLPIFKEAKEDFAKIVDILKK